MIIGVGIDIVDVRRIDSILRKFKEQFLNKIYTDAEIRFCYSRSDAVSSLAKMFSLKEATIKALSDAKGIGWHDMQISHDENGKPIMNLSGKALEHLKKKTSNFNIQVSVSDEKKYAIAYVIIESI